ncbi:MAG: branched-chain amino acid ABC transporter permease [Oscillospiraceae bacterium]|nr:branched-chain amino acid ABC transporter permease [Oscillospiraceae bacterium]
MDFLSNLISGLSLGSIYALIALGYTMVYGIAKMLNFAHGDIIMVGAFASIVFISNLGLPMLAGVALSVVVCVTVGVLVERIAYKPLRNSPPLSVLITAIGVSYFLQSLAQLIFGTNQKAFPKFIVLEPVKLGRLTIKGESIVTMAVTFTIMVCLTLFINKTKLGKAMRAVSEDRQAAELMGISVNRTITLTFAIGSALASVAGSFYGLTYGFIGPYTGSMPGIKAFVAAVFGGIGSIPGAMLGGILLGVIENLAKAYISTELSDAIVFGVLILVLLIKPTGLLGKKTNEKV